MSSKMQHYRRKMTGQVAAIATIVCLLSPVGFPEETIPCERSFAELQEAQMEAETRVFRAPLPKKINEAWFKSAISALSTDDNRLAEMLHAASPDRAVQLRILTQMATQLEQALDGHPARDSAAHKMIGGLIRVFQALDLSPEERWIVIWQVLNRYTFGLLEGLNQNVRALELHGWQRLSLAANIGLGRRDLVLANLDQYALDREAIIGFAKTFSGTYGDKSPEVVHQLGLSPSERLNVALALVKKDGLDFEYAAQYGLSPTDLFEVGKAALEQNPIAVSHSMRPDLLPYAERFELAKLEADLPGWLMHREIQNFGLNGPDRAKIALKWFSQDDHSLQFAIENFSLEPAAERKLRKYVQMIGPRRHLEYEIENFGEYESKIGIPELKEFFSALADKHPDEIPAELVPILWDRVQKREVGLRLLDEAIKLKTRNKAIPKNSLELLAAATGLDPKAMQSVTYSEAELGRFYELALDLQRGLPAGAFENIALDPRIFSERKLEKANRLLSSLRSLKDFYGNNPKGWSRIKDELELRKGISADRLDEISRDAGERVVAELKKLFKEQKLDVTFEEFEKLSVAWGDLTPIYVLLSRFQGTPKWREEIPLLARVFKASLQGDFKKLKFEGLDSAEADLVAEQLGPIANRKKALEHWKTDEAHVYLPEAPEVIDEKDLIKRAKDIIVTNLYPNIALKKERFRYDPTVKEVLASEEADLSKLSEKLGIAADHTGTPRARDVFFSLAKDLSNMKSFTDLDKASRFLRSVASKWPEILPKDLRIQALSDLNSVQKVAPPSLLTPSKDVLLTVRSSDPKFMLEIGNLVNTSSCQDYRTGSHIETLLGYVLDANVEGMASFSLKPTDFPDAADFEKLLGALKKKEKLDTSFDGNRKIVTLRLKDGTEIRSRSLGHAFARQILKLGTTDENRPGLYLERPYSQTHPNLTQMLDQQKRVMQSLARKLGATTQGKIQFAQSRNPGGVYSDAAAGAQTHRYSVNADEEYLD